MMQIAKAKQQLNNSAPDLGENLDRKEVWGLHNLNTSSL